MGLASYGQSKEKRRVDSDIYIGGMIKKTLGLYACKRELRK